MSWLIHLLWLRASIVVREFHPHFTSVFSSAVEIVPSIALPSTCHNDFCEVDPSLADELSLLVVIEDRHFEVLVVRRVMYGEAKLLVPGSLCQRRWKLDLVKVDDAYHRGVCPPLLSVFVFLASFPNLAAQ